jgi:glycosyltransferase involved in cell wall biosynthesis
MNGQAAPRRILILLTSSSGGAGTQALQLARGLDPREFAVEVAFGPGEPLDREFAELGLPVHHLSLSRGLSPLVNLRGLWQVKRLLERGRYAALLTSCSLAGFVGRIAARLVGTPVVIHIIQVWASRPWQPLWRQRLYRQIERGLDRWTTHYVAASGAMAEFGVQHGILKRESVEVIFNAAELPPPAPGSRSALRRELGIPDDAPLIGTLGRLEPQKGVEHFLAAALLVLKARPEARFLVVGQGPLQAKLEGQARELGIAHAVRFTGWRRDVAEVLNSLDVLALASLWEPFGIVLAEAMLAGLPVVATSVDGIPEVVAEGQTGWLVKVGDERALADRLLELIADPLRRQSFGQAGRARALTLFSVERMVRAYAACLQARFAACAILVPRDLS